MTINTEDYTIKDEYLKRRGLHEGRQRGEEGGGQQHASTEVHQHGGDITPSLHLKQQQKTIMSYVQ
jgi:hypothetical protein